MIVKLLCVSFVSNTSLSKATSSSALHNFEFRLTSVFVGLQTILLVSCNRSVMYFF